MENTPLDELFLKKKDIRLLKTFSDGEPRNCKNNIEEFDTLVSYGLLTDIKKSVQGLSIPTNNLKISIRGQKYLQDLKEKRIHFLLTLGAFVAAAFAAIHGVIK